MARTQSKPKVTRSSTRRPQGNGDGVKQEIRLSRALEYEQDMLGTLRGRVIDFQTKKALEDDAANSWAKILVPKGEKIEEVRVRITRKLMPGVKLFHFANGQVKEIAEGDKIQDLRVRVTWKGNRQQYPSVIEKDADGNDTNNENIDLILVNQDGQFIPVEFSVVTRNGEFLLTVQELYAGGLAVGNKAAVQKFGKELMKLGKGVYGTVVPLWAESAYPNADFIKTWRDIAEAMLPVMYQNKMFQPVEDVQPAEWNPTPFEELGFDEPSGGRLRGWCTWYNIAYGAGFMFGEDGKSYFVHFKQLPSGQMAILPMRPYEFMPMEDNGHLRAEEITRLAA